MDVEFRIVDSSDNVVIDINNMPITMEFTVTPYETLPGQLTAVITNGYALFKNVEFNRPGIYKIHSIAGKLPTTEKTVYAMVSVQTGGLFQKKTSAGYCTVDIKPNSIIKNVVIDINIQEPVSDTNASSILSNSGMTANLTVTDSSGNPCSVTFNPDAELVIPYAITEPDPSHLALYRNVNNQLVKETKSFVDITRRVVGTKLSVLSSTETFIVMQSFVPSATKLYPAYPNPLITDDSGIVSVKLLYDLAQDSNIKIRIYTITGRLVKAVADKTGCVAGRYTETWDGKDDNNNRVAQGTYLAVLSVNNKKTDVIKIVVK
jgi:hypothetical protein